MGPQYPKRNSIASRTPPITLQTTEGSLLPAGSRPLKKARMSERPAVARRSAPGDPSPAVRNLAEWFRQLDRLMRAARAYGADHASVCQGRVRAIEDLCEALRYHAPLVLRISPLEIFLRDELLVHSPQQGDESDGLEMEQRLPFLMYRDGVRGLTLPASTTEADVTVLVDAMIALALGFPADEDLYTWLWEASLEHIRVDAASLAESLAQQRIELDTPQGMEGSPLEPDAVEDWRCPAVGVDAQGAWESLEIEMVTERAPVAARLRNAESRAFAEEGEAFLRSVMAADPCEATRDALSMAALTWLSGAVGRCELDAAERAERLLRELDPELMRSGPSLRSLLMALDHGALSERLEELDAARTRQFFELSVRLGSPAIELIVGLMARAGKPRLRAAATTALAYICNDEPHWLAPFLRDSRWHVVRNIVFVLGQIGGAEAGKLLAGPARHLDARVRRAVVTALAQAPQQQRIPLLLAQLECTDTAMLASVLTMLARENDPRVAPMLLHLIDAADFETRPDEVKLALLGTLGDVADDAVIPALAAMLNKGGWFARRTIERTAAARTLARIGSAEALHALHESSHSSAEAVRTACLEALHTARAA